MSVGFTSLAQRLLAAESDSYRGGVACSTQLVSEISHHWADVQLNPAHDRTVQSSPSLVLR